MMSDPGQGMTAVDRAFALAASPHPRQVEIRGGAAATEMIALRVSYAVLPRRLTLATDTGESITLLLRRRRLVGVAAVEPAALWAGAPLPVVIADDEEGDAQALAAADTVATLLARSETLAVRFALTEADDDTSSDGLEIEALLEPLAGGVAQDGGGVGRAGLMTRFYDRLEDMPRVMFAPDRRADMPDATPALIRKLFDGLDASNVTGKPGDAPEVVMFEQGDRGDRMTVKVSDENRLCLVHAFSAPQVEALMAATWQLKRALDGAAESGAATPIH